MDPEILGITTTQVGHKLPAPSFLAEGSFDAKKLCCTS